LRAEHKTDPGKRVLQKTLAKELTTLVHGAEAYEAAVATSKVLFSGSLQDLAALDESTFLDVFDGVPQFEIAKADITGGCGILEFMAEKTSVFPSKSEAKKMIVQGGLSINKEKVMSPEATVNEAQLINNKYILIQKGKENYYLCCIN